MGLRLLDASGSPPGFWRSVLRLFGLGVAIAIAFLGFVPVLVDDRRRALQDFLAGTAVFYDELAPLPDGRRGRRRRARASHRRPSAVRGLDPRLLQRARPARLLIRVDAAIGVAMALLVLAQAVLLAAGRRARRSTARRSPTWRPRSSLLAAAVAARAALAWSFEVAGRRAAARRALAAPARPGRAAAARAAGRARRRRERRGRDRRRRRRRRARDALRALPAAGSCSRSSCRSRC